MNQNELKIGLSRLWREAYYNFPYWYRLNGLDWDAEYAKSMDALDNASDLREAYFVFCRFVSLLCDGHTTMHIPKEFSARCGALPFSFVYTTGGYYIDACTAALPLTKPTRIASINGIDFSEFIESQVKPYCWHEQPASCVFRYQSFIPLLLDGHEFELETDDGRFTLCCECKPLLRPLFSRKSYEGFNLLHSDTAFEIYESLDNTALLVLKTFADVGLGARLALYYDLLLNRRGIVIDVRDNMGGFTAAACAVAGLFTRKGKGCIKRALINNSLEMASASQLALMSEQRIAELIKSGVTDEAELALQKRISSRCCYKEWQTELSFPEYPQYDFNVPMAMLTSRRTCSAAEDFILMLKPRPNTKSFGEPSFGSTGTPMIIKLPYGWSAQICSVVYLQPDGSEFIGSGVKPDVEFAMSPELLFSETDIVLSSALDYLRNTD